jgi:FkbM family methyltransferase
MGRAGQWAASVRDRLRRPFVHTLVYGLTKFDVRSWLALLALQKLPLRADRRDGLVALGVRGWGGRRVYVRPGTTDWLVTYNALFEGYQRPPGQLGPLRSILDLGANIGVTTADLAEQHPQAEIMGVELDTNNWNLARRNIGPWSDRISLIHGAVWHRDGRIAYQAGRGGEWAYHVIREDGDSSAVEVIDEVPAYSMTTLIDKLAPSGAVDYVKMDIEGAEVDVLADGEAWAPRVRCIKVEVHVDVAECESMLKRLGFSTMTKTSLPPTVTGVRGNGER